MFGIDIRRLMLARTPASAGKSNSILNFKTMRFYLIAVFSLLFVRVSSGQDTTKLNVAETVEYVNSILKKNNWDSYVVKKMSCDKHGNLTFYSDDNEFYFNIRDSKIKNELGHIFTFNKDTGVRCKNQPEGYKCGVTYLENGESRWGQIQFLGTSRADYVRLEKAFVHLKGLVKDPFSGN